VEIADIPQPTPTDRPWWRLYYSGNGVYRLLANPVVTFGAQVQPLAEVFMQDEVKPIRLIRYRQFWVPVEYTVAWYDAESSEAAIRLNLAYRRNDEETWQPYDTVEHVLNAVRIPDQRRDTLGLAYYSDTVGTMQVRAEVILNARQANGETMRQIDVREFVVTTFSEPEEIELDTDAMLPNLEGLADTIPLLDWRAWRGGPCNLADRAEDSAWAEALSDACAAFDEDDFWGVLEAFGTLGDIDDPYLAADTMSNLGIFLLWAGDFSNAENAFQLARELSETLDDVQSMLMHMNNQAAALAAGGDVGKAYSILEEVNELRNQFWDEGGIRLLNANTAYLGRDYGQLIEARNWFSSQGLPQTETLNLWIFRIENGM
jgi:tetratricopeptide (TPR) repeat protein